jgi:hypothetical protein
VADRDELSAAGNRDEGIAISRVSAGKGSSCWTIRREPVSSRPPEPAGAAPEGGKSPIRKENLDADACRRMNIEQRLKLSPIARHAATSVRFSIAGPRR